LDKEQGCGGAAIFIPSAIALSQQTYEHTAIKYNSNVCNNEIWATISQQQATVTNLNGKTGMHEDPSICQLFIYATTHDCFESPCGNFCVCELLACANF
jgi:hypothetical protein